MSYITCFFVTSTLIFISWLNVENVRRVDELQNLEQLQPKECTEHCNYSGKFDSDNGLLFHGYLIFCQSVIRYIKCYKYGCKKGSSTNGINKKDSLRLRASTSLIKKDLQTVMQTRHSGKKADKDKICMLNGKDIYSGGGDNNNIQMNLSKNTQNIVGNHVNLVATTTAKEKKSRRSEQFNIHGFSVVPDLTEYYDYETALEKGIYGTFDEHCNEDKI